jgi:oligoribonuclease NrnB/cAMP/cGMP phosphodiesterase (DHH superfamily)
MFNEIPGRTLTVNIIIHGDDADGLTCGALINRVKGGEVYLTNYDNLENTLEKVNPPVDLLYICDLNIRDALEPELLRINEFAKIHIIDHHQMTNALMERLREKGIIIRLEIEDCAAVLVYDTFRAQLGDEGKRLAAYAAISDMFENGPIAEKILAKLDRKFAQHEAQLLTHALSADQSTKFKRKVMEELGKYNYPHRIPGVVEKAVWYLEEMTKIKEVIPKYAEVDGRVALMEAINDYSTGGISNLLIDALGVDVGISYKVNGEFYNMSMRGQKMLEDHLGNLCKEVAGKYGGFGGGHQRASGLKIPIESLEQVLKEFKVRLN